VTRTVALVSEYSSLRAAITGGTPVPSVYACDRFAAKLRTYGDMLAACIDRVTASLRARVPELGRNIAINGSDIPAYANGQRFVSKNGPERDRFSDRDACWGHRSAVSTRKGGGFYSLKIDMAVCTATDLPLAWNVRTARDHEAIHALPLIDAARARGFAVETAGWTRATTLARSTTGARAREMRPIIPLRQTPGVKRGDHKPPTCDHGEWRFAGADDKRKAAKWRCPTGECKPASAGSRPTGCTR
jgi:hypothetical protein